MANADTSMRDLINKTENGAHWLSLLDKGNLGNVEKSVFDQLSTLSADGIQLNPIYPIAPDGASYSGTLFRVAKQWETLSRIDHPSVEQANKQLLHDLENGADGSLLILEGAPSAHGFGIASRPVSFFERLLNGIFVDATNLRFDGLSPDLLQQWISFCQSQGYAGKNLNISLGVNPFEGTETNQPTASTLQKMLPFCETVLSANGCLWHNKGATAAQELGLALSQLVGMLRLLSDAQIDDDKALTAVDVNLSCDADQFETISKFRAMRILWARLLEASGLPATPLKLHATTSWRMLSRRDPWTNILRTTMATFSAGIGGADSITVLPHTQALGLPDAFARRVARNTSLILQDESHLHRTVDPAAGAGLFDAFSVELAEKAWTIFQTIEADGGVAKSQSKGTPQKLVLGAQETRLTDIARRKIISLGNSNFPKLDEQPVDVLIERQIENIGSTTDLSDMRDGALFEQLLERAEALASTDQPSVALVCLGNAKGYKPRESFAADLFAAGGLATLSLMLDANGTVHNFNAATTAIVCLCGSDDSYEACAETTIASLKAAGAKHILVAGRGNFTGADDILFMGCNAHKALHKTLRVLEGASQ